MEDKPVKDRIPDAQTALDCLKSLYAEHRFGKEESLFKEDARYSLQLLQTALNKGLTK
jgi:hypothetical protein